MRTRYAVAVRRRLREQRRHKRRLATRFVIAIVAALITTMPASAQDPAPGPAPSPSPPAETPAPKSKLWTAALDGGGATVGTAEELKPYARARLTVVGDFLHGLRGFARGDLDRTPDGGALSLDAYKTFASIEASAGVLKRLGNLPVSVGVLGGVTWSREAEIKSPTDPRLWTALAVGCIERFAWWPDGGLACLGVGQRGPAGGPAASVSLTLPVKGGVATVVDFDLPFRKLPEFLRAIPAAARSAPPTPLVARTAPTAEEIRGVAQRLPIAVKVGVLVRAKSLGF